MNDNSERGGFEQYRLVVISTWPESESKPVALAPRVVRELRRALPTIELIAPKVAMRGSETARKKGFADSLADRGHPTDTHGQIPRTPDRQHDFAPCGSRREALGAAVRLYVPSPAISSNL